MTDSEWTAWRIGERVRTIREQLCVSVFDLAGRVGIAPWIASAIENGSRLPTFGVLYRLAAALRVAPSELLPSEELRPRVGANLPLSDDPESSTVRIVGGGPGSPTQTYLFDLRRGESDGGFRAHAGNELLVVTEGEVVISELDQPDDLVRAGQSRFLDTRVPHTIRGGDLMPGQFLLVCGDAFAA